MQYCSLGHSLFISKYAVSVRCRTVSSVYNITGAERSRRQIGCFGKSFNKILEHSLIVTIALLHRPESQNNNPT